MLRMPCSIAFFAASSAASCAAKGVDLREPLNPRTPADDQATTLPDTSVIVTTVLLKVDWMCAIPLWMFFLTFFLVFTFDIDAPYRGAPAGADDPSVFFLIIPPLRGPLRVREFVCVRWPRTGNPLRWRSPR